MRLLDDLLSVVRYFISALLILLVGGIILFWVLWNTGYIERAFPGLYCTMAKQRQEPKAILLPGDRIGKVVYHEDCTCDTTYYAPAKATP